MPTKTLQRLFLIVLVISAVLFLTLYGSFGESNAVRADEQVSALIAQETTGDSEEIPSVDGQERVADEPGISFSIWAAVAVVLGFGFGGILALRSRAKAKKGK